MTRAIKDWKQISGQIAKLASNMLFAALYSDVQVQLNIFRNHTLLLCFFSTKINNAYINVENT